MNSSTVRHSRLIALRLRPSSPKGTRPSYTSTRRGSLNSAFVHIRVLGVGARGGF
jgi:hypothetical protein